MPRIVAHLLVLLPALVGCRSPKIVVGTPSLDVDTVTPGATITATVPYRNAGRGASVSPDLAVEAVAPGAEPSRQIDPTGRYFEPRARGGSGLQIAPGDTYTLRVTFTPMAADPPGQWRACPRYVEIHDAMYEARGPCVPFTVTR